MKKSFSTMLVVAVAVVFLLSACGGGGDDGPVIIPNQGSPGAEVPIAESTPHSGSVAAFGDSFYTFTASTTSTYTIGVTNTGSDLSWSVWDSTYTSLYGFCDSYSTAADEVCSISLTAGVTYYLVVSEWDTVAGYFTLTVTP